MSGMLYLVATPIGNLEDITQRALRVLSEVDLIACEDTRTSRTLLAHYEIKTPCVSYHKFNEREAAEKLVQKLLDGQDVALVTDAGMPGISDPGVILVQEAQKLGVSVTALPGASAVVTALALAGQDTAAFVFEGFLPQKSKEKKAALARLQDETRTMVLYEAPHRLVKTLAALAEVLGEERSITLCRELTKKFETVTRTTLGAALADAEKEAPRGEYVLVIAGKDAETLAAEKAAAFEDLSLEEHVQQYLAQGLDEKEAMRAVAQDRNISKREVYNQLLKD